jgi:hypothetical protein
MGELKDTYTLPDGKKVDFAKGTAEEDVLKVLNTDHAESMAFTSQPKSKPENPGFFTRAGQAYESGFDNSTDKLAPGLDIVRAKLTGNQELYEQTQEDLHELGRAGEVTNPDAPTLDSVKGAFAEEGVGAAVSEGVDFVANSIGSTLGGTTLTWGPVIGTAVIAGAALSAGVIAAPTAALAGLITGAGTGTLMFTQFLADNLARGHDAGILDVNDVRLMESLGAAAVQTGSEKLGMRMFGIGGNIAGNAVKQAAIRTKAGLVKQAWQKSLGAGAAAAGKSLATETGTELGQQVMERAAAGLPVSPSDEAAMHEYTEVIAATLAGSLPFSGYAGGNTYTQNARDVSANKKVEETNEFNAEAKRKSIAREQANKGRKELEEQTQTRLIQEELMAESKDEERLAILEEDERAKLEVEGIVGQERTLTDVKLVAASRGIDIDSTPSAKAGFIRVVRGVTGSANIKDATPQEMELIYQKLSTIDTGGANSALPLTSTSEAFEIAEKLEKDQKKNKLAGQTAVQVKRKVMALIKKEETIYDPDHVSLRADAIIKRMLDRTLMLRNTEETSYTKKGVPRKNTARKEFFNIALGAMQDLAGDEKRRVATTAVGMAASNVRVTQDSKGNGIEVVGEYPSREELRDAVGDIPDDVYKEVRDSLHARGILKKEKGKFLYADVPDVLTTRREFAVSTDQVSKWIVRDKAGKVVAVENTQLAASNAKKARPDAKVLSKPVREKGYAVRETEFSDVEGGEPRRLRSMNVDFVANLDPTSRGQAEDRALNLGRLNQKSREEYLGTQGTEVESGTNAQLPEQARIRLEEDQAKQVEIAKVSPYAEARAIDRLKLNLPKDSPARETLTQYDQEGQWYIPANQHGEVSTSARVVIKRGIWDEETGRGFGGERMDANSPNWRNDLHDLMELITGLTPKMMRDGITGKQVQGKYVQDQFGPTSPLTMHVEHAGRVIVTNGTGDSAQTFVFDYIDDGPDGPEFHLVNHFDSTKNFIEEVEDIGPLNNLPEKRGPGVKAESVRVSENPDKAERMSLADRVAASIDEMSPMERNAARLHKGPPKGGFWAKMSKAMDRFFNSENVMQRFRINVIDKFDRIVTREGQLMDQDGNIIEDEMSAVAAVRAYARVADMVSESLMNGYIKATAITNAQGEHEGAMIYEAVPFDFTNETVEMTIYNPATGQLEKKIFNAEVYKEEVSGMQGGMINARTALTPEENRLLNNYRSGLRSHNLRQRAILDGKKPVVPHTVEEELEWMQILNGPEGARIAVAVHNLNKLNEKTVEFLVATQVLSETEAAMWMENSDYIEFYRDFEGDSNYAEQMQRQREQAGVPGSLLGDITYEGPHKRFRGWSSDQGSSGTQEKVDPIEAAVSNYVGAITAGTINVARTRAVRNEVALDAARLVKDKKTALAMGIRATTKIRVNGQDQHYIIDDDLMFSALEGEWGQSIGETLRNDKYLKWMTQLPTQLLRETVTRDPSFIVPNLVRDATAAWLKYGSMEGDPKIFGPLPIITRAFGRSISNFRSDQQQRGELRRSGAKKRTQLGKSGEKLRDHGATTGVDDVSSHRGAKQIAGHAEKKIAGKKDNLLKQAWATAGRFSSFSESATREIVYEHTLVQEKKKLANSGKYSPADIDIIAENRAIHQAKEVLNFSTKGKNQYLSIYTSMVPFFNAFIQGADVMGRSMTGIRQTNLDADVNSAAHYKNVWRRAGYLFVAGAILEAMLMDDDDYESVSQYKRDNNYLIPDGFGGYWTIPAPHGVGWMLKQVPQQIARNIVQVSRGEGNKAARELANTITPTYDGWLGDGQRMPQVMKPFYEGFANQKLFGGGDINKRHQEGLDAADKHTSKTTAQAKLLGKVTGPVFGASPQNLDQVVGTMTGGLGAGLWGMFDAVLRFGGAGVIRPPGEIMKLPVLNRLHVDSGNQSLMSDYYKFSDMLFRAPTMLNAARSPQERQQIRKDNRSELIAAKQMKPIKQQMNKLRKKKEDIRLNSGGRMTRQAQKKQLDNIEVQERRILLRAAKVEEQMHARNAR